MDFRYPTTARRTRSRSSFTTGRTRALFARYRRRIQTLRSIREMLLAISGLADPAESALITPVLTLITFGALSDDKIRMEGTALVTLDLLMTVGTIKSSIFSLARRVVASPHVRIFQNRKMVRLIFLHRLFATCFMNLHIQLV